MRPDAAFAGVVVKDRDRHRWNSIWPCVRLSEVGVVSAGEVRLEGSDAAELAELLAFVRDWLGSADDELLAASLRKFVGSEGYDLTGLRTDLAPVRVPARRR